jgi:hypothetical protein
MEDSKEILKSSIYLTIEQYETEKQLLNSRLQDLEKSYEKSLGIVSSCDTIEAAARLLEEADCIFLGSKRISSFFPHGSVLTYFSQRNNHSSF